MVACPSTGTVIGIQNYANRGGVNGLSSNPNNRKLCARATGPRGGQLLVAPCYLPNQLAGPYWILGYGEDAEGRYEWAVVIAGQPDQEMDDGCTTREEARHSLRLRPARFARKLHVRSASRYAQ